MDKSARINCLVFMAALVAVTALAVGCRPKPPYAPPSPSVDPLPMSDYPKNVALQGLGKALVVAAPVVDRGTDTRPMRISVPIRSKVDKSLNIQYRYEFFDPEGRPLKSSSGWKYTKLEPRVQAFLEGAALETQAVDWRLQIRPAR